MSLLTCREYMELLRERDYYRKRCQGGEETTTRETVPTEPVAGASVTRPLPSPTTSVSTVAQQPVPEDVEIEGQGQLLMDESGVSREGELQIELTCQATWGTYPGPSSTPPFSRF